MGGGRTGILAGLLRRARGEDDGVLAAVRAGGGEFARVEFTRNRRVMVSVGDAGATLRLHEAFRRAPADVLRAAAGAVTSRDPRARAAARDLVRAYLRENPPAPAAPRRRRARPGDRAHLARLQAEFDRVNAEHFAGALPRVPLHLSGRMRSRNGHFSAHPPEIVLSRSLCEHAADGEAEQTLRHEMIHLWQHVHGQPPGHGASFRRWALRLDVHPRATRAVRWKC